MSEKHSEELNKFIALVPKHLRKYIAHGIFIVPCDALLLDYASKKEAYLNTIRNTQTGSANSMHKYTSVNPLSPEDVNAINNAVSKPLNEYYNLYLKNFAFKNNNPEPFFSFAITYHKGHRGLSLHTDDSTYTVNLCLQNSATGNEVVFHQMVNVEAI
jgi:hypothetical protein